MRCPQQPKYGLFRGIVEIRQEIGFNLSALIMTLVTLLAGYLPARRAASTDPMRAIRCE
jgi:hypothetical protein